MADGMSEADVIARLYRELKELALERDALLLTYNLADKECERLRGLVGRAADALEKYTGYPLGMVMSVTLRESGRSVLAELRKAAE
jgi:hypothetical protein